MNDLALIAIGAAAGFFLAVIAVMVAALWHIATGFRRTVIAALNKNAEAAAAQSHIVDKLRSEVALAMSKMDAERMYEASLAIQRASKSLNVQVDTLQKAVFAHPAPPAFDLGPDTFTIEDEAAEDARIIAERNRWAQPDPLAGLTDEEKNRRVSLFFEQRRRDGMSRMGSAPPTAGAGAYATLLEEAQPAPAKPPADIHEEGSEEPWDLDGKGELGE